jgi:PEP-CTERM motif-containing protein
MKRPTTMLATIAFLLVCFGIRAQADPLVFTSGRMVLWTGAAPNFGVDFTFSGSDFEYTGEADWSPKYLEGLYCWTCTPVRSEPVFHLQFSPSDVLGGVVRTGQPQQEVRWGGDFVFHAPPVTITETGDVTPFTVSGTLTAYLVGSTVPFFQHEIIGGGRLQISSYGAGYVFDASDVQAPIPEPATLMLFAGGALLVARRRRMNGAS